MKSKKGGLRLGLILIAAVALPAGLAAQQHRVELTLFGGVYVPTDDAGLEAGSRPATRRGSGLGGARLTIWGGGSIGAELTGGFSPARVSVQAASGSRFARGTDLGFGSAKLVVNLTPNSGVGLILSAGAAGLRTTNPIADPDSPETSFGGVAGVTIRLPIGENVAIRGDAEDYIYSVDFGLGKKTTNDLMLSAGLQISF